MNNFASRCTRPSSDKNVNNHGICVESADGGEAHLQLFVKRISKDSSQHTSAFCYNDRGIELIRVSTRGKQNNDMYSYLKTKIKLPLQRLLSSCERFVWAYRFRSWEWMLLVGSECWWWPTRPAADCGSAAQKDTIHFLGWWFLSGATAANQTAASRARRRAKENPARYDSAGSIFSTNRKGQQSGPVWARRNYPRSQQNKQVEPGVPAAWFWNPFR